MRRLILSAALTVTAAHPTPAQAQAVRPAAEDGRAAAEANRRKFVAAYAKGRRGAARAGPDAPEDRGSLRGVGARPAAAA